MKHNFNKLKVWWVVGIILLIGLGIFASANKNKTDVFVKAADVTVSQAVGGSCGNLNRDDLTSVLKNLGFASSVDSVINRCQAKEGKCGAQKAFWGIYQFNGKFALIANCTITDDDFKKAFPDYNGVPNPDDDNNGGGGGPINPSDNNFGCDESGFNSNFDNVFQNPSSCSASAVYPPGDLVDFALTSCKDDNYTNYPSGFRSASGIKRVLSDCKNLVNSIKDKKDLSLAELNKMRDCVKDMGYLNQCMAKFCTNQERAEAGSGTKVGYCCKNGGSKCTKGDGNYVAYDEMKGAGGENLTGTGSAERCAIGFTKPLTCFTRQLSYMEQTKDPNRKGDVISAAEIVPVTPKFNITNTDGTMGSCTANIIGFDKDKCTGYLLTNSHCIEHDGSKTDLSQSTFSTQAKKLDIEDFKVEKIDKDRDPDLALISFKAKRDSNGKCNSGISAVKICDKPINACNYFLRGGNDYGGNYSITGRMCSLCKCLGIYYGGGSVKVDTTCAGGASGGGIYAKPKGKEVCLAFVTNAIDKSKGETIAVSNEAIINFLQDWINKGLVNVLK